MRGPAHQTVSRDRDSFWMLLLYGSGLRLMEALRLRIKDVDFERREITVHEGKGNKDRRTMLPQRVCEPLRGHLAQVRRQRGLSAWPDVQRRPGCGCGIR